jgi:hypothetical protein
MRFFLLLYKADFLNFKKRVFDKEFYSIFLFYILYFLKIND